MSTQARGFRQGGELLGRPWVETPEPALDGTFAHIRDYWPELTRPGDWLAFPLPHDYVRPGGFFKMFLARPGGVARRTHQPAPVGSR